MTTTFEKMAFEGLEDVHEAMKLWARVLDAADQDPEDRGFDVRLSNGRVRHFIGVADAANWAKLRIKEWVGRVAELHQRLGAISTEKHQPNGDVFPPDVEKGTPDPCAGSRPSPESFARWRAVDKAATPGPWFVEAPTRLGGAISATIDGMPRQVASADGQAASYDTSGDGRSAAEALLANAEFIAEARTAVPALLAEVKRLDAEIDDLRMAVISVATFQIRRRDDGDLVWAYRQTANDRSKPFSLDRVEERIAEMIERRQKEDAR